MDRPEAAKFQSKDFLWAIPEEALEALDSGPPPQSMLGAAQKAWFLERLRSSSATWKSWDNTVGSLDWRTDFQNVPHGAGPLWPGEGYATFSAGVWAGYRTERAGILDFVCLLRRSAFEIVAPAGIRAGGRGVHRGLCVRARPV
jgi:phosphodiesterase/alkaline phosphatase D-like protein